MASNEKTSNCDNQLGFCGPGLQSSETHQDTRSKKPLEIYTFIDPLCPECWAIEPMVKKLQVEYGDYVTIKYFVSSNLETWNLCQSKAKGSAKNKSLAEIWERTASRTGMSCDGDLWHEDPISTPYIASVAIKAAEMQGKQAGTRFLRKLRESLFLDKKNITKQSVLVDCAKQVGLDVQEFNRDLHSQGAIKALQCDLKTTKEMEVDYVPTFVFFNDCVEDAGLKVTGFYPFDIYTQVIHEVLGFAPPRATKPSIEHFMQQNKFVATIEVAVVYDISIQEAERKLKELVLKQKVELVPVKYGTFWRYVS
ncbi:ClpXP adapter SpxH family protein [Desertibacillus haloalkaliphilus]|uniref:ClpXP adapter SpxH family protein n=1 Tax=Desertibacillus haloalkaliphilus TaxID=1328930 RepID=UPI001C25D698|nr:ClpXP adapter SpxH family protein [Desertibacillus haloalkaliphilus]MBU8906909.1 DsbA family protein [Desertibacillus haloalkaliphilus]